MDNNLNRKNDRQMDGRYCALNEAKDTELFGAWNGRTGWFTDWEHTPRYDGYDIMATGASGQRYAIELKRRNYSIDEYGEWMVESDKIADGLMMYTVDGVKPLYVNFFADGKVAVWSLAELPSSPRKEKRRRYNPGTGSNDVTCVYYLPIESARVSALDGAE